MIKPQILSETSSCFSVCNPKAQGNLHVLLEGSGEKMQWKTKDAFNFLAVASNYDTVFENPRYTDSAKV
jgi:hypothetical protein